MLKEAKKAQGLSVNAIILIVLGVLILVLLIVGVTFGWNRIFPFINPPANVQEISDQCQLKCSTQAVFDFCNLPREVNLNRETARAVGLPQKISASCADLAQNLTLKVLGIQDCPGLCNPSCVLSDVDDATPGIQLGTICDSAKCLSANVASETFRDLIGTKVCCKTACTP